MSVIKTYVPVYQGDRSLVMEFQSISIILRQMGQRINTLTTSNSITLGAGDAIYLTTSDGTKKLKISAAFDPLDGSLVLKQDQINV